MNILLSAYACEPNKGSEPGVGWSWAIEIAKHHNVWVITRDNNEPTITSYIMEHTEYKNERLHFIFVGLSKKLTCWKRGRRGVRLFYMIWQYKAAKVAITWNRKVHFDLVQHITFVSFTQPSYMYKLNIPMIWGPVAGGDNIPNELVLNLNIREKMIEILRHFSQHLALLLPSIRKTIRYSKYIFTATEETRKMIPMKYQNKSFVLPTIGIERLPVLSAFEKKDDIIRIVMVGNLIYLKAVDIGMKAYLELVELYPDIELHILGEGKKRGDLKKLADSYIENRIFFEPPIPHDDMFKYYQDANIYMTTTLRDSGCMSMLEAMSVGLPCICIATGGPKLLSFDIPELQIVVSNYDRVVNDIKSKLIELIENENYRETLGLKSRAQSINNLYCNKYLFMNKFYSEIIK